VNRCLVNHGFLPTVAVQRANPSFSAVASFSAVGGCVSTCALCAGENSFVMGRYYGAHAWHTTIAHFDVLAIEYFMKPVVLWEMLID